MFYDVQNPNSFVSNIRDILDKNGIWVMEMYYLPILLRLNAYDSICHEHITYFSLRQINFLCKKFSNSIAEFNLFKIFIFLSDLKLG